MLTVEPITGESKDRDRAEALYTRAFPANERHPFRWLLEKEAQGLEILGFYENGVFCGLAVLLCSGDIAHIVYFAIEEALRSKGYGTRALQAMHRRKAGFRVIVDVEREDVPSQNPEQRRRRRAFYLRCGYRETEVKYRWRGEEYEILAFGGSLTHEDFRDFWESLDLDV